MANPLLPDSYAPPPPRFVLFDSHCSCHSATHLLAAYDAESCREAFDAILSICCDSFPPRVHPERSIGRRCKSTASAHLPYPSIDHLSEPTRAIQSDDRSTSQTLSRVSWSFFHSGDSHALTRICTRSFDASFATFSVLENDDNSRRFLAAEIGLGYNQVWPTLWL